jgi:hypothetical protein
MGQSPVPSSTQQVDQRWSGRLDFFMQEEPVEVFGIGFGFVAMKQGVFEKSDRPWFRIEGVKWDGLDFECNVGEDYSFCVNG